MTTAATLGTVNSRLHRGDLWTEQEFLALPIDDTERVELMDWKLHVSPLGDNEHQRFGQRLAREFERLLPDHIDAYHEANVRLGPGRIVIPDGVVTVKLDKWLVVEASDVLLVAEVVSPSGVKRDKVAKPELCATAKIPWYLLVEREPKLKLTLLRLQDGAYAEHATAGEGEVLDLPDLDCSIEVDALLRKR
jgi:Uma2 family endonuclease